MNVGGIFMNIYGIYMNIYEYLWIVYDYFMNTDLTYDSEYSFKHQNVKQIVKFLSTTIPNDEVRDYLLYTLASYIFKTNTHNQKQIVIIGD